MPTKTPAHASLTQQYRAALRQALQTHLPRTFHAADRRRLFGVSRYALDARALQKALAEPLWELLDRGGKRWRPVLFLLILRALGKDPLRFLDIAVIFELIHTGTLIIDDVEDASLLRRGGPTLHRLVGTDIAINAGNALYVLPLLRILERKDLAQHKKLAILDACVRDLVRLHAGQGTDIVWHKGLIPAATITERQYLQMCAYKTGCLTRMAATVAGILGDARPSQCAALGQFAETLGMLFQIQDDLLNIRESTLSKGKGLGEDITEGKRSLLVIHALRACPQRKRKRLLDILAMHTNNQRLRNEAIAIIRASGAIERTERTMERLRLRARRELTQALPRTSARAALEELTLFLTKRDH